MEVVIRENYDEMSKLAAQMVAEVLNTKPNAVLGMATGSTPLGLYQELVRMYQRGQLDFSRVMTFNLDEYVGPPRQSPAELRPTSCRRISFKHVNVQPQNINVPSGTTSNYPRSASGMKSESWSAAGSTADTRHRRSTVNCVQREPTSSLSLADTR
jgi:glucosamine-6-phosphate deaminase